VVKRRAVVTRTGAAIREATRAATEAMTEEAAGWNQGVGQSKAVSPVSGIELRSTTSPGRARDPPNLQPSNRSASQNLSQCERGGHLLDMNH
jgi:hypothetical protein